ncbi:MAG: hypothetical protein VXZ53_00640 [Planctomycetota bacterium]|nr:hypothetical protein [Planctomycetota bacterium]
MANIRVCLIVGTSTCMYPRGQIANGNHQNEKHMTGESETISDRHSLIHLQSYLKAFEGLTLFTMIKTLGFVK